MDMSSLLAYGLTIVKFAAAGAVYGYTMYKLSADVDQDGTVEPEEFDPLKFARTMTVSVVVGIASPFIYGFDTSASADIPTLATQLLGNAVVIGFVDTVYKKLDAKFKLTDKLNALFKAVSGVAGFLFKVKKEPPKPVEPSQ